MSNPDIPIVLCLSGSDPTGGAGIQADIEAIASHGCMAAPVVTAITAQNTHDVIDFFAVPANLVIQQARAVLEDMPVACIKIGMVASVENVEAIHSILHDYPDIKVIYDPVLATGGGSSLASDNIIAAVRSLLLPLVHILTPNTSEAHHLASNADTAKAAAMSLLECECEHVLLTGTHANTTDVTHTLYSNRGEIKQYSYTRIAESFHGSGCTLAASIAAQIAHGDEVISAVHQALDYTYNTLLHGYKLGHGQSHPNRFYWLHKKSNKKIS